MAQLSTLIPSTTKLGEKYYAKGLLKHPLSITVIGDASANRSNIGLSMIQHPSIKTTFTLIISCWIVRSLGNFYCAFRLILVSSFLRQGFQPFISSFRN